MSKEIDKLEILGNACKEYGVSFSGVESNAILKAMDDYIKQDGVIIHSISQILINAENATELKVLSDCWKEVVDNKYKYPLLQLRFAREHLENLSREMARKDIEENKEFFYMWKDIFNTSKLITNFEL